MLWKHVEIWLKFPTFSSRVKLDARCRFKHLHDVSSNWFFFSSLAHKMHVVAVYFFQFWSVWLNHLGLILGPAVFFLFFFYLGLFGCLFYFWSILIKQLLICLYNSYPVKSKKKKRVIYLFPFIYIKKHILYNIVLFTGYISIAPNFNRMVLFPVPYLLFWWKPKCPLWRNWNLGFFFFFFPFKWTLLGEEYMWLTLISLLIDSWPHRSQD